MGAWAVPKLWSGRIVFILGGGPSLPETDFSLIRDSRIIGVNYAFALGNWVDACWFGDSRFFRKHRKALLEFGGLKATCCISLLKTRDQVQHSPAGIHVVGRSSKLFGITTDPKQVSWNKNSGASAINFAVHLGAATIVLLGFDMHQSADGRNNYHDAHDTQPAATVYERRFLPHFPVIKRDLDSLGIRCLNATPGSSLHVFEKVDLADWIASGGLENGN